jgi:hypothetical protein
MYEIEIFSFEEKCLSNVYIYTADIDARADASSIV